MPAVQVERVARPGGRRASIYSLVPPGGRLWNYRVASGDLEALVVGSGM